MDEERLTDNELLLEELDQASRVIYTSFSMEPADFTRWRVAYDAVLAKLDRHDRFAVALIKANGVVTPDA